MCALVSDFVFSRGFGFSQWVMDGSIGYVNQVSDPILSPDGEVEPLILKGEAL